MVDIKTDDQFRQYVSAEKPTVAVFKTTWCKDCHYLDVFFDDILQKYADDFTFIHVDRDELPDLCGDLNILGIPSFLIFHKGREITRFVSKLRKTREEVEQFLDRSLQVARQMA